MKKTLWLALAAALAAPTSAMAGGGSLTGVFASAARIIHRQNLAQAISSINQAETALAMMAEIKTDSECLPTSGKPSFNNELCIKAYLGQMDRATRYAQEAVEILPKLASKSNSLQMRLNKNSGAIDMAAEYQELKKALLSLKWHITVDQGGMLTHRQMKRYYKDSVKLREAGTSIFN